MANISRLSSQDASTSGTTGLTITFPQTPTQGNLLVCVAREEGGGGWTATPSGWTNPASNGSGTFTQDVWYKIAGSSEPTAVTFGALSSSITQGFVFEFSGIAGSSPVDLTTIGTSISSTNVLNPQISLSSKTSQADELVIGNWLWRTDSQTLVSWGGGFSALGSLGGAMFVAYKILRAVDTATLAITVTGTTSGNLYPNIVTFKGATNVRKPFLGAALTAGDGMSRSEVAN